MNINHRWLKENHIAFFDIEGDIEFEDLETLNNTILEYLNTEVDHDIHCVFTTDNMGTHPINVFKINRVVNFQKHSSLGWIFLVTQSATVNFISSATSQVTKVKQKTVASLEELSIVIKRLGLDNDDKSFTEV